MKMIIAAALLCASSTLAFAAGRTVYPPDASGNAISIDKQVKARLGKTHCMFSDPSTGQCSIQSVYNGGSDGGGSSGAGAGGASGSSGSAGASAGAGSGSGSGSGGGSGGGGSSGGGGGSSGCK